MRKVFGTIFCTIILLTASYGQELVLTLTADLSSKLPNRSPFTAVSDTGEIYSGQILTHRAGHWLKRGSLLLEFNQPVLLVGVSDHSTGPEGEVRPGHKRQVLGVSLASVAGIAADDYLVDPFLTTGGHKNPALYLVDAGVTAGVLWLQKGGEAKLTAGTKLHVVPAREHSGDATR